MKNILITIFLVIIASSVISQDKTRKALTFIFLNNGNGKRIDKIEELIKNKDLYKTLPTIYDSNKLEHISLNYNPAKFSKSENIENITKLLNERRIPNKIVDYIFNEENGKWSYNRLFKRAKYNMTDADYKRFEATYASQNTDIDRTLVLPTLQNNYIIVYEYLEPKTSSEINAVTEKKQNHWGISSYIGVFVFKIHIDNSVFNLWVDNSMKKEEIDNIVNKRQLHTYKIELISSFTVYNSIGQSLEKYDSESEPEYKKRIKEIKSTPELSYIENLASRTFQSIQSDLKFDYGYRIFKTNPISVKIGTKEGVEVEDNFEVFENIDGKEIRCGSIVAKKITFNKHTKISGNMEPSIFRQTQGRKLDKGMLIKKKKSLNGTLGIGYNVPYKALTAYFDMSMADIFNNDMFGWRVYVDGTFTVKKFEDNKEISIEGEDYKTNCFAYSLGAGIAKKLYFMRNFSLMPFAGGVVYQANFNKSGLNDYYKKEYGDTYGMLYSFDVGCRLSMKLSKHAELMFSGSYSPLEYKDDKTFGEHIENNDNPFHLEISPIKLSLTLNYW